MLGWKSHVHLSLSIHFWLNQLICLNTNLFIYKTGVIIPSFIGSLGESKNKSCEIEKCCVNVRQAFSEGCTSILGTRGK